jgi:hypothetical protein
VLAGEVDMKEISDLAEASQRHCAERSPHATMPCEAAECRLARFALAVLDALDELPQIFPDGDPNWGEIYAREMRRRINRELGGEE